MAPAPPTFGVACGHLAPGFLSVSVRSSRVPRGDIDFVGDSGRVRGAAARDRERRCEPGRVGAADAA